MPTEPDAAQELHLVHLSRELLAHDDIASALAQFSSRAAQASFELHDAGGLVSRVEADMVGFETTRGESRYNGSIWHGICQVPEREKHLLDVWLLLMEQFDRRTAEAWTDPLTGLPNRRWLAFELERRPPALVGFFDVIGLQATNREHGHSAGDERLRAAAEALKALGGRAFRVGGDEFVVVLPETPAATPAIPDGLRGGWGSDVVEAERQIDRIG